MTSAATAAHPGPEVHGPWRPRVSACAAARKALERGPLGGSQCVLSHARLPTASAKLGTIKQRHTQARRGALHTRSPCAAALLDRPPPKQPRMRANPKPARKRPQRCCTATRSSSTTLRCGSGTTPTTRVRPSGCGACGACTPAGAAPFCAPHPRARLPARRRRHARVV